MATPVLRIEVSLHDLTAEQKRSQNRLNKLLGKLFEERAPKIAEKIGEAYVSQAGKLAKLSIKAKAAKIVNAAADELDWSLIADDVAELLGPAFEQSGQLLLGRLQIDDDKTFNLVSEAAVDWAEQNAADLVTGISETTRDRLQSLVVDAIKNSDGVQELKAAIKESPAFQADRAEMIARTELGNAHMGGALEGAKSSGLELLKSIIRGSEEFDCDICEGNEDDGEIDLEEDFSSGDDAPLFHPNCECTMIFSATQEE